MSDKTIFRLGVIAVAFVVAATFQRVHSHYEFASQCVPEMTYEVAINDGFRIERESFDFRKKEGYQSVVAMAVKPVNIKAYRNEAGEISMEKMVADSYFVRCTHINDGRANYYLVQRKLDDGGWELFGKAPIR